VEDAVNLELMRTIDRLASESLSQGCLLADGELDGVRALDRWEQGPHAAMLFTVDEDADLAGTREPVLYDVYLERAGDAWQGFSGGMLSTENLTEAVAALGPGLHEISRTSRGPVRLIWALASPEVARVTLMDDGQTRERKPGRDGFVLFGTTQGDPITHVHAVDPAGRRLPTEPILL
jgi:hypothetical protein